MDSSRPDPRQTLRRLPLFTDLTEEEMTEIAKNVRRLHYPAGGGIFSEGDICSGLFVVEEGEVRILKSAPSGRLQLISIERRGSSLGEVPALDGGRHPVSAEAIGAVILLRLPADRFREICLENPQLSLKVFKVLGHRLRRLTSLVEELSFSTVRERLIAYLLRLADETGLPSPDGVQFALNENNEELAARLGTVRELVSRNLGRLHGGGLIQMRRRMVTIPDVAVLKNELGRTS